MSTTLRATTSAVLGTVTETAEALTSTVNTIATGVHMINDTVTDLRQKNLDRIAVSNVGYRESLLDNAKKEILLRKVEIKNFLDQDPQHLSMWNEIEKEFENVFDKN